MFYTGEWSRLSTFAMYQGAKHAWTAFISARVQTVVGILSGDGEQLYDSSEPVSLRQAHQNTTVG